MWLVIALLIIWGTLFVAWIVSWFHEREDLRHVTAERDALVERLNAIEKQIPVTSYPQHSKKHAISFPYGIIKCAPPNA